MNAEKPDEAELERRRARLEQDLSTRRSPEPAAVPGAKDLAGVGQGFKIGSEFIAGVLVGAGIGWVFDRLLGTSPFGLIVFLLLGFGAGVLNVLRAVGKVAEPGIRRPDAPPPGPKRGE
jgi:ATP synthase protein I